MASDSPSANSQQRVKWTVMIFMGAATIDGEAPMMEAAEDDLNEMRFVGSDDDEDGFSIFVQVHLGGDKVPLRGRITKKMPPGIAGLDPVPERERETANGAALLNFIRSALRVPYRNGYDSSRRTLLVLWGHAYDFAIGRAPTAAGTIDALDFAELSGVLETLQKEFGIPGAKLDILGCDACDLSTVEMAYQIKPFAKHLLCSEIGVPIPGWPYDRVLYRLRHPVGEPMNPVELGTWTVRRFCEAYSADVRTVSLTLLDLNRADELLEHTKYLSLALASAIGDPAAQDRIASLFLQSQTAPGSPYVDVADLCWNLERNSNDLRVIDAATKLGDFLIESQVGDAPLAGTRGIKGPFVMEHGRNTCETARLNGISIYAPHVAPNTDFVSRRSLYENFVFTKETLWSELVHVLAGSS
jgi:Clostripain family